MKRLKTILLFLIVVALCGCTTKVKSNDKQIPYFPIESEIIKGLDLTGNGIQHKYPSKEEQKIIEKSLSEIRTWNKCYEYNRFRQPPGSTRLAVFLDNKENTCIDLYPTAKNNVEISVIEKQYESIHYVVVQPELYELLLNYIH